MATLQKKICLLGAFAVGKTSLVSQFVHSRFSEKYHTTVGVKIDKKSLKVEDQPLDLIIWDLHGEDHFQQVRMSYLRGSAGYLLVADGTREETLDTVRGLQKRAEAEIGDCPFLLLVNKSDLEDQWEMPAAALEELEASGWIIMHTSAKTGEAVEQAFADLSRRILDA